MRESMDTFVKSPGNALAVEAMESLRKPQQAAAKLFIEGSAKSGKSTLVRSWAEDAARSEGGNTVFACSGADMAMALQFEADDSFFDRLGATPVLIVDDLEPLTHAEKGDQLLSLMLAERERQGFGTVITSRKPLADYRLADSNEAMRAFKVINIEPLDEDGLNEFVRMAFSEYTTEASPSLEDDAVMQIVAMMKGNFTSMEHAARYLATDEGCARLGTLDAKTIEKLLSC